MYPLNLIEEELKNKVAADFFSPNALPQNASKEQKEIFKNLDSTKILGRVDFCISYHPQSLFQSLNFLWAEAKSGNKADIIESFIQLILTIGKEKPFENELPPLFLGAFDCEKIAFVPYDEIDSVFSQNDFNWNVPPSNHKTKEFTQLYAQLSNILESKKLLFFFKTDSKELKDFIALNFTLTNSKLSKMPITKTNFAAIYQKWCEYVAPSISIDWEKEKPDILDSDFFLADLLSENNSTKNIIEALRILLESDHYKVIMKKYKKKKLSADIDFIDNQKAHTIFWNLYERPPKEEYWGYIIERRDRLVPLDIRERKGAFFTPQVWVRKAHEYLERALGRDWQEEYYIWDCAAGTGNLLANLTESRNLYASTLDNADVEIMGELARKQSLHLIEGNIFQFDFLNDELFDTICEKHKKEGLNFAQKDCKDCQKSKIPDKLQEILKDEQRRQKLVIFINPPYAEATSGNTPAGTGKNKSGVSTDNMIYERYKDSMGKASNELFAQFFFRIYREIRGCKLAAFSKLKYINSSNFVKFRESFQAKFLKGFICPAYTFDNVKGQFPIGFLVWDLSEQKEIKTTSLRIHDNGGVYRGTKKFYVPKISKSKKVSINQWIKEYDNKTINELTFMGNPSPDFQHNTQLYISQRKGIEHFNFFKFYTNNIFMGAIYFAVRHCIKATWLNDRDQFLYPNKKWQLDSLFHSDCLAFMLFHGQNRITCKEGINHFIPFSESEVGAKEAFQSDFMIRFIKGKIKPQEKAPPSLESGKQTQISSDDFYTKEQSLIPTSPLQFSDEAKAVFEAGRKLWQHYHAQARDSESYLNNAALYDIKAYFQGFDSKGKMNTPSKADDSYYKDTLGELNHALHTLAKKLEAKVYEYEFLIE